MSNSEPSASFPTTRWTLVQIVKSEDHTLSAQALEAICERYWYPMYVFLRRSGHSSADAEDLTQMLFEKLVQEDTIKQVHQERGRLRSFLISVLKQVVSRKVRHDKAAKRGEGLTVFSLDEKDADRRYADEPADIEDPELLYDRAWARQMLETVRGKLKKAFFDTGKEREFEVLEPCLGLDDAPVPMAELAAKLDASEGKVRVAVHRLRKKFRDMLEEEISTTLVNPGDIAEEMEWMRKVLTK